MPDLSAVMCDAHIHIFPPARAFLPAFETAYAPPSADVEQALAMLNHVGARHAVAVQPGVYGTDPAALLDAIARSENQLRGVAAVDGDTKPGQLAALFAAGVRGLRFTEMRDPASGGRYRGTVGLDALDRLAPAMRDVGLHAQLWMPLDRFLAEARRLPSLGIAVVLDHMAMIDTRAGLGQPAFQTLLALLGEGWLWVKLALCRVGRNKGYADVRPFHDALVAAAPNRLLWASDWPFVRLDPAPDPLALRDRFLQWVPDDEARQAILADNSAALYQLNQGRIHL